MKYVVLFILAASVSACSTIDYVTVGTHRTKVRVERDHDSDHERCRDRYRERDRGDGRKEKKRRYECRED